MKHVQFLKLPTSFLQSYTTHILPIEFYMASSPISLAAGEMYFHEELLDMGFGSSLGTKSKRMEGEEMY